MWTPIIIAFCVAAGAEFCYSLGAWRTRVKQKSQGEEIRQLRDAVTGEVRLSRQFEETVKKYEAERASPLREQERAALAREHAAEVVHFGRVRKRGGLVCVGVAHYNPLTLVVMVDRTLRMPLADFFRDFELMPDRPEDDKAICAHCTHCHDDGASSLCDAVEYGTNHISGLALCQTRNVYGNCQAFERKAADPVVDAPKGGEA